MLALVSFSSTINSFIRGDITEEEMWSARMFFSCGREHALPDDPNQVGYEAAWSNKEKGIPAHAEMTEPFMTMSVSLVDDKNQDKVRRFQELLRQADQEGRVEYRIGNQFGKILQLPPDWTVSHMNGRRFNAGEYQEEHRQIHGEYVPE